MTPISLFLSARIGLVPGSPVSQEKRAPMPLLTILFDPPCACHKVKTPKLPLTPCAVYGTVGLGAKPCCVPIGGEWSRSLGGSGEGGARKSAGIDLERPRMRTNIDATVRCGGAGFLCDLAPPQQMVPMAPVMIRNRTLRSRSQSDVGPRP